jgi:hypothetical protein
MNDLEYPEWAEDSDEELTKGEVAGRGEAAGGRLWFFAGLALLLVLVGVSGWMVAAWLWFGKTVIANPGEVMTRARRIADFELPPELKADRALQLRTPFQRQPALIWARFVDSDETCSLVLAQSNNRFSPELEALAMRASVEQSLGTVGIATKHVVPGNGFTYKVRIQGEEVTFVGVLGKDPKTRTPAVEVVGLFPGKEGTALLLVYADANKWSREPMLKILDSIR